MIVVVVTALLGARCVHLDADVPPWFAPEDLGLHLDDGYKTLAPRNLVERGATHWHPQDDYPGWFRASPLTQWLAYAAFRVHGVDLVGIRVVGVAFFVALVVAFVGTFRRSGPPWAVALGALVLSAEPMLYHFSRVALFEVPLATFTALGLFAVYRSRQNGVVLAMVMVMIAAALAWKLVKPSGFLYLVPALVVLPVLGVLHHGYRQRTLLAIALVGAITLALLLHRTRVVWSGSFHLEDPAWWPLRLFTNGLQQWTPLVMSAALLCAVHGVLTRPREYLGDAYRLVTLATLCGVPMILAFFETPPPRYYTAMVPAAPLLVADHFVRGAWRWRSDPVIAWWARGIGAVLAVALVWFLLRSVDYAVLRRLPVELGESAGVYAVSMYRYFAPVALLVFVVVLLGFRRIVTPRTSAVSIVGMVVLYLAFGIGEQVRTLVSPTHDGQAIRDQLVEHAPPDATIGGDWAPILTLGTGRPTLYVNDVFNPAPRFPELRLQYFLSAGSWQDELNLTALRAMEGITLSEPVLLGTMLGREILLYELAYEDPPR